jgi:S1-C subfamily serine protease
MDDEGRALPLLPVLARLVAGGAIVALTLAALLAYRDAGGSRRQVRSVEAQVAALRQHVARLESRDAELASAVGTAERSLRAKESGLAPLAARVLRSVFTVETDRELGSGFAAWFAGGNMYLVTANHVVAGAGTGSAVTVVRKGGSWSGEVVGSDARNDLALVRVSGHPAGAAALWQAPRANTPRQGDELLLVGSPFGLEGTVTTGVVSRVTGKLIQTDAAANPGNSGGPAVDRNGRVVGVLVSGAGENLNFAVPIGKACALLRRCGGRR